MIKQIITTVLLTSSINNAQVVNSGRDTGNFTNYPAIIQSVDYDQQNNLTYGAYYQVKELQQPLNLQYATANIKGYTYLEVNKTNEIYHCYTDYYILIQYNNPDIQTFEYVSMSINLRGYINPNTSLDPTYEEYYLYAMDSQTTNVNNFIFGTNYTYASLETLRQTEIPQISTTNTVDTVETNTTLNLNTRYQTIKFRIVWTANMYDSNEHINVNLIPNLLNALSSVYTSTTTVYNWTFQIEYKQEIIDIPGLIFTILGMPFAWISTAFNLTLFPGTPYVINVADLFLSLIGILILIIIIRKMLK